MNRKKNINVAIIGTGFGAETHLPAFNECKNATLYTIFGRNKIKIDTLSKKFQTKKKFDTYKDLLNDKEIDLISISLPPSLQFNYVNEALDAGKHVLCEKPFTCNKDDAYFLYKKAKKNNLLNAVGFQLRFQPARKTINNFISGNDLGKIISVNMSYDFSSRIQNKPNYNWWSSIEKGGGVLNAMGSHKIDLLRWWFGDPYEVFAHNYTFNKTLEDHNNLNKKVDAEEISQIIFKFKNDINCTLNISSVAIGWKASTINIYAEKGSLFLEGEEKLNFVRKTTAKHNLTEKEVYLNKPWVSGSIWRAAFFRQINALIESLTDSKIFDGANFYDGYKVQEIIHNIRKSSIQNRPKKIKYK